MDSRNELYITIVVLLVILMCGFLIYCGHDGDIKALLGLVVGAYIGRYLPTPKV
jgi:hypothetical protein